MAEILTSDLTTKKIDGTGIFDEIMSTVTVRLEEQFAKQRIKATDYSKVYLAGMEAAMQQSIVYLLGRQKADKEAELLTKQIAQTEAETTKIEAEIGVVEQQALNAVKEGALLDQELQIKIHETGLTEAKKNNEILQGNILALQPAKVTAETSLINREIDKATKESTLLTKEIDKAVQEELILRSTLQKSNIEIDTAKAQSRYENHRASVEESKLASTVKYADYGTDGVFNQLINNYVVTGTVATERNILSKEVDIKTSQNYKNYSDIRLTQNKASSEESRYADTITKCTFSSMNTYTFSTGNVGGSIEIEQDILTNDSELKEQEKAKILSEIQLTLNKASEVESKYKDTVDYTRISRLGDGSFNWSTQVNQPVAGSISLEKALLTQQESNLLSEQKLILAKAQDTNTAALVKIRQAANEEAKYRDTVLHVTGVREDYSWIYEHVDIEGIAGIEKEVLENRKNKEIADTALTTAKTITQVAQYSDRIQFYNPTTGLWVTEAASITGVIGKQKSLLERQKTAFDDTREAQYRKADADVYGVKAAVSPAAAADTPSWYRDSKFTP